MEITTLILITLLGLISGLTLGAGFVLYTMVKDAKSKIETEYLLLQKTLKDIQSVHNSLMEQNSDVMTRLHAYEMMLKGKK